MAWDIFNLLQQVAQLLKLAHPHQRSAWRCPLRQSYDKQPPPSPPPAPTALAASPRVQTMKMPARRAAPETRHKSSRMRRRSMLTRPSWASQKQRSRLRAQMTATRRPPSGCGGQLCLRFLKVKPFYIRAQTEAVLVTGWKRNFTLWHSVTLWKEDLVECCCSA